MLSQKKKKFSYRPVLNKPFNQPSRVTKNIDIVAFPDDFKSFSQISKKQKIGDEKKIENIIPIKDDNFLPQEDLMDDDFDFTQAANEIDQIEIAASQMISAKNIPKKQPDYINQRENQDVDILDELLSGTSRNCVKNNSQSKFSLKLPKKKVLPNETIQKAECSTAMVSIGNDQQKQQPEKRKYDIMENSNIVANSTSVNHIDELSKKRENELKIKKENDSIELLNTYKRKMEDAEQKYLSKDGEIRILRETLRKLSEDERKYKDKIQQLEQDLKTQQSEKEGKLVTEVEKLKTQLTFKEKEVQDALEKQKKSAAVNVASKPKSKSPKVGFYSDAFEKSGKCEQTSASSKNKNTITERTSFQCKTLKNLFAGNMLQVSSLKDIEEKVVCDVCVLEKLRLKCSHEKKETIDSEGTNDFSKWISSVLELVNHDDFFIPQFVSKVTHYLQVLFELLSSQNNVQNEAAKTKHTTGNDNCGRSNVESENSSTRECKMCIGTYLDGLQCLKVLSNVSPTIKEYLLNGLSKYLGKEVEIPHIKNNDVTIDDKLYFLKYLNISDFILVQEKVCINTAQKTNSVCNDFEAAVQFWTTFGRLMTLNGYENVESILFKFHTSLIPYPVKIVFEVYCLYLIEHQLLTKHLTSITVDRLLNVIKMLQKFIGSKAVCNLMCNRSERCPLLVMYNWLINEDLQKDRKVLNVFQELVCFQSSLISYDQALAFSSLLESECRCSNEVIEFLITFLFDEFKYFQKEVFLSVGSDLKSNESRLSCFRQGMSLLYLLCCNESNLGDKISAVECTYIYLLAGTIKLFRKIPSINDKEVLDLEDLLDMDQHIDLDFPVEKMETAPCTSISAVVVVD